MYGNVAASSSIEPVGVHGGNARIDRGDATSHVVPGANDRPHGKGRITRVELQLVVDDVADECSRAVRGMREAIQRRQLRPDRTAVEPIEGFAILREVRFGDV